MKSLDKNPQKKAKVAKKCATKSSTASKKKTPLKKDKFYIDDYPSTDKALVKEDAGKKRVRESIRKNIKQSQIDAKHKKSESKISRLKRVFSLDGSNKTVVTVRYGSIKFYQGVMNGVSVFNDTKEDFTNKLGALNHLEQMINDDKWFNEQYAKYLKVKKQADKKSAKTKQLNKGNTSAKANTEH